MIRVVVADDHALVRGGFQMILEAQPDTEVTGKAANGLDAVELARSLAPDVVLMDVRMPGLDGIEATRRVTASSGEGPRVLMLTTFDLDEWCTGRSGRTPAASCSRTCARLNWCTPCAWSHPATCCSRRPSPGGCWRSSCAARPPGQRPAELGELTDRESEVLGLVARGLSNAEIAQGTSSAKPPSRPTSPAS